MLFFERTLITFNLDKNPPTIEEVDTLGSFEFYERKKDVEPSPKIQEEKIILDYQKRIYNKLVFSPPKVFIFLLGMEKKSKSKDFLQKNLLNITILLKRKL